MSWRRILVTGAAGQIGWELARVLPAHGETVALDRTRLDLASPDALAGQVRDLRPDLIVNAAAYTAVDRAETEPELAHAVNAVAPGILAVEARRLGAVFVHYSTDYVFDGSATEPYTETSPTRPLGVYGATKLAGERAIAEAGGAWIVLRTSWVYGLRGGNFLRTIRRLAAERDELRVVDDQVGTPNWCRLLAEATASIVDRTPEELAAGSGIYHLTCSGRTTWYGFARAILGSSGAARLTPITTEQYPTPARRPLFSVLSGQRLAATFGVHLPDWQEGLRRCLGSEQTQG